MTQFAFIGTVGVIMYMFYRIEKRINSLWNNLLKVTSLFGVVISQEVDKSITLRIEDPKNERGDKTRATIKKEEPENEPIEVDDDELPF